MAKKEKTSKPAKTTKTAKAAKAAEPAVAATVEETLPQPRRSVAFIGSECYPFVKTGGPCE